MLANWIFIRPETLDRGVIHKRNARRLEVVAFRKVPAVDKRCSERREIIRADRGRLNQWKNSFVGVIFNHEARIVVRPNQGHSGAATDCRVLDARQRDRAPKHVLHELSAFGRRAIWIKLGIVRHRQPDSRDQHVLRTEAGIHIGQSPEAAQQQPGADHQHQRQRELSHDQEASNSMASSAEPRAGTAFLQGSPEHRAAMPATRAPNRTTLRLVSRPAT